MVTCGTRRCGIARGAWPTPSGQLATSTSRHFPRALLLASTLQQVYADDAVVDAKHCDAEGKIKPRRALPLIRAAAFFSQLVRTDDGRWVCTTALNGWPVGSRGKALSRLISH